MSDAFTTSRAECFEHAVILNFEQAGGKREWVARIEVERRIAADLGERTGGRGENGTAKLHGLQQGQAKAFIKRRQHEGGGAGVERDQFGIGYLAGEAYSVAKALCRADYSLVPGTKAAYAPCEE